MNTVKIEPAEPTKEQLAIAELAAPLAKYMVVLDPAAAKAYKQLERDLLLELDDGVITADTTGVLTGTLLQL